MLIKNLERGPTMLPNKQKHRVGTHNVTQQTKTQSGDAQCYPTNKNTEWGRTVLPNEQKHRVGTHNVTQRTKTQSGDAQCYPTNKNTLFWTPLSIII